MSQLIFLIGMPGAGKTYWGRLWAEESGWQHIDLDEIIEQDCGKSIRELFEQEGQVAFRKKEQETLHQVVAHASQPTIISCGGGTPVFFDNLDFMKGKGCVVYLAATVDALLYNLQTETTIRPLLSGDPVEKLLGLLSERGNIYLQAHLIYEVESLTESTFAEILSVCTNRHL